MFPAKLFPEPLGRNVSLVVRVVTDKELSVQNAYWRGRAVVEDIATPNLDLGEVIRGQNYHSLTGRGGSIPWPRASHVDPRPPLLASIRYSFN